MGASWAIRFGQDEQLKAFLSSGPTVSLRNDMLALIGGTTVIWLAEVAGS